MSLDKNWYEVVTSFENISHGDIIIDCPLVNLEYPQGNFDLNQLFENPKILEFNVQKKDVIVMSQACDLEVRPNQSEPKIKFVLVAALRDVEREMSNTQRNKIKDIGKLKYSTYYLLKNSTKEIHMNMKIVHFDALYTIPWKLLNDYANKREKRLRLIPPYSLQLSQHFGHYFARIGIPDNIEESVRSYFKQESPT